jgi:hypothetical protein
LLHTCLLQHVNQEDRGLFPITGGFTSILCHTIGNRTCCSVPVSDLDTGGELLHLFFSSIGTQANMKGEMIDAGGFWQPWEWSQTSFVHSWRRLQQEVPFTGGQSCCSMKPQLEIELVKIFKLHYTQLWLIDKLLPLTAGCLFRTLVATTVPMFLSKEEPISV